MATIQSSDFLNSNEVNAGKILTILKKIPTIEAKQDPNDPDMIVLKKDSSKSFLINVRSDDEIIEFAYAVILDFQTEEDINKFSLICNEINAESPYIRFSINDIDKVRKCAKLWLQYELLYPYILYVPNFIYIADSFIGTALIGINEFIKKSQKSGLL